MDKLIFNRGVDLPKNKYYTKDSKIEEIKPPKVLYFPMSMHIGKPADVVVEVGDKVKMGSLLGKIDGNISASLHSSVSGTVIDILERDSFRGKSKTVVIENDFKDEQIHLDSLPEKLDIDSFKKRIKDAGITGKGGAGFPTHVKYNMKKHDAEYLLINGAECEPYSTTHHRVMVEYSDSLIEIAKLIGEIYHIDEIYFAVEDHDEDAKKSLENSIEKFNAKNIKVYSLSNKYPAGHADLQIEEVLGIEKKDHQRSGDIGVLQSNVSTLKAIFDAVLGNETFHKRVITVSGPVIKNPKNLMVPIGTTVEYIVEYCGGLKTNNVKMINGGPMMGRAFKNIENPVHKDTTSLLFLPSVKTSEESPCIRCAKCVNQCPMNLQPILISNAYRNRNFDLGHELKADACINCGVCTYVCPAKIDLLADIKNIRKEMENAK